MLSLMVIADSFIINFNKQSYATGNSLIVSGDIFKFGMLVIAMNVYDPDGKILSAYNLEITTDKILIKMIQLDSPFYEKLGQYVVNLTYG